MENDFIKVAEDALKKAENIKQRILAPDKQNGEEGVPVVFPLENFEERIENLHELARIDKAKAVNRLRVRLQTGGKHKKILRRRLLLRVAGVAAAIMIACVCVRLLHTTRSVPAEPMAVIKPGKIIVPTLLHEQNRQVVAVRPLASPKADNTYVVAKGLRKDSPEKDVMYEKVVIPVGYTYTVALTDGTTVILNAGSELRFPSRFPDTLREVELKGEAYFKVAKSRVPFVVKAGNTRVKVYGTQFNFLYSPSLGIAEAVLVEGEIGMRVGQEEKRIRPNQRIFCTANATLAIEDVDPADYIAWMGDSFKYNGAPLGRIVHDISRWYGIRIELAPELENETYSMAFDKSFSEYRAMQVLRIIIKKEIKKEGGTYYIK